MTNEEKCKFLQSYSDEKYPWANFKWRVLTVGEDLIAEYRRQTKTEDKSATMSIWGMGEQALKDLVDNQVRHVIPKP